MSSSPTDLAFARIVQPLHPLSPEDAAQPAATAVSAPRTQPAPIAALDALVLCAETGALGG